MPNICGIFQWSSRQNVVRAHEAGMLGVVQVPWDEALARLEGYRQRANVAAALHTCAGRV